MHRLFIVINNLNATSLASIEFKASDFSICACKLKSASFDGYNTYQGVNVIGKSSAFGKLRDMKLNDYGEGERADQEDGAGYENEYVALSLGLVFAF